MKSLPRVKGIPLPIAIPLVVAGISLACVNLTCLSLACAPASFATPAPTVTLEFPAKGVYGWIGHLNSGDWQALERLKKLKWKDQVPARGKVTIPVGEGLIFSANGYTCDFPEALDKIDPAHIRALVFDDTELDDDGVKHLGRFTNVEWLDLTRTEVTDEAITQAAKMKNLRMLDLSRTMIKGSNLELLVPLKNLRTIKLAGNNIAPGKLKVFAKSPQMVWMDLRRTLITDGDIKALSVLPRVRVLDLDYNRTLTNACVPSLATFKELECISLEDTSITGRGLAKLKGSKVRRISILKGQSSAEDLNFIRRDNPRLFINEVVNQNKADPVIFGPLH